MDSKKPLGCGSRRDFLCWAGVASLAVPFLPGCGSNVAPEAIGGSVPAGNVSALATGAVQIVPGTSACIARDAQGIYAMTLICPHADCDMTTDGTVSSSGIVCTCHGSRFDTNGAVVRGPASRPLTHYAVTKDDAGELTIHGDQTVSAETRLAV